MGKGSSVGRAGNGQRDKNRKEEGRKGVKKGKGKEEREEK